MSSQQKPIGFEDYSIWDEILIEENVLLIEKENYVINNGGWPEMLNLNEEKEYTLKWSYRMPWPRIK